MLLVRLAGGVVLQIALSAAGIVNADHLCGLDWQRSSSAAPIVLKDRQADPAQGL